jgi:hypothetical protein
VSPGARTFQIAPPGTRTFQSAPPGTHDDTGSFVQQGEGGTPEPAARGGVDFVSPPSSGLDHNVDNDEGDPLRFRKLDDLYARGATPLWQAE